MWCCWIAFEDVCFEGEAKWKWKSQRRLRITETCPVQIKKSGEWSDRLGWNTTATVACRPVRFSDHPTGIETKLQTSTNSFTPPPCSDIFPFWRILSTCHHVYRVYLTSFPIYIIFCLIKCSHDAHGLILLSTRFRRLRWHIKHSFLSSMFVFSVEDEWELCARGWCPTSTSLYYSTSCV